MQPYLPSFSSCRAILVVAWRNGVGLCWRATRQGIAGPRVRQWRPRPPPSQLAGGFFVPFHWTPEPCLPKRTSASLSRLRRSPAFASTSATLVGLLLLDHVPKDGRQTPHHRHPRDLG